MKIEKDSPGHQYVDIGNIRLTYIPAHDRSEEADWSGQDVFRFQAYRAETTQSLHRGAELPVADPDTFLALVEGLCLLYRKAEKRAGAEPAIDKQRGPE